MFYLGLIYRMRNKKYDRLKIKILKTSSIINGES